MLGKMECLECECVSANLDFDMWTGGAGDRTTKAAICGQHAIPPETQPPHPVKVWICPSCVLCLLSSTKIS